MSRLPSLTAQQAFEATARTLSVRAAADELCVTPGAVSRQIKLLEEHFGVALLRRAGRGIALTAQGAAYAEDLRAAFEQLRAASRSMDKAASKVVISLRSYTTFATRWLIPRLATFQMAHPEIEVKLSMSSQWTDLGEYDAAIRLGDGWTDYRSIPLVPNVLAPVCSPDTAKHCRDDVEALATQLLLTTPHRPDDWRLWLAAAGVADPSACRYMSFESSAVAYQTAIISEGVALAQLVLVEQDLKTGQLVCPVDRTLDRGQHTYHLVWAPGSAKEEAIRDFGAWLRVN